MEDNIIEMVSIALDAVFDPLPEIVHHTLQHRSVNIHDFLTNGILHVVQITGLVSIYTTLQIPPQMIQHFLTPGLRRKRINPMNVWFQQDGATAHAANASMNVVRNMFPGKLISRFGDVPWPPRSPDLSICDFFLWGYLKGRVYTPTSPVNNCNYIDMVLS